MDQTELYQKYGKRNKEILERISLTVDLDKYTFIFPTGSKKDLDAYIQDAVSFLQQDGHTFADSVLSIDLEGQSLERSLIKSMYDDNYDLRKDSILLSPHCKNMIIPIVANGFVATAAKPGTRQQVSHDYLQDVVQNSTLKKNLPDDRNYLVFSPFDTDDIQFHAALSRFGHGQFTYYQPYIGVDPDVLYALIRDDNRQY